MATASRIRAFQLLSSRTLELLCEEASAHLPTPLERLERLCADVLFDRQRLNLPLVSSFPESELPF
ncbi:hypothetical protein H8F24_12075 [Synechococcus sp. CBW1002]|uniref:hypothetical protein n=1 Tax=Synechococcus sp. CBW1002 TaxID=1353134 RepID=UPI0018CE29C2|nr:hypothetical protein [Synechococcus sp. CBW1002]QPN58870.1 hypothetical protein H8F24_12075 [Synechococcus sp. CBW1002]